MYSVSKAFPVNVSGEPVLTRQDVWEGLQMKARNALPFVVRMQECEVIEVRPDGLTRNIKIRDEHHQERITFTDLESVRFERVAGPTTGHILNLIETDDDGELSLRFTFELERNDTPAGSDAERRYFQQVEDQYAEAVASTLTAIRQLKPTQPA
jgi:hypothetical protein